ncbi:MAG: hypothetical protein Ct9H90mP5_07800 [Acidimicrobiaceae bacterium]|nr:MAG: hypothetical protein Ct9H90mP5_07800 [Acidimicrobiaceae bacterium]
MLFTSKFSSPIGSIRFVSTADNLKQVILPTQSLSAKLSHDLESKEIPLLLQCAEQLEDYFLGKRKVFSLPLEPEGTPFQVKAWMALCSINYGETVKIWATSKSYWGSKRSTTSRVGKRTEPVTNNFAVSSRHRFRRKLRGYAGGTDQLYIKEFLINHERANL